jgi:hypothetical protein
VPLPAARFTALDAERLVEEGRGPGTAGSPALLGHPASSGGTEVGLDELTPDGEFSSTPNPPLAPLGGAHPLPSFEDPPARPGELPDTGHLGQIVNLWHTDPEISWYGPGMYGQRTACGEALTTTLVGVAHRTLPCGTLVQFRWNGVTVNARVVDRGPYVAGRMFDMTAGLCARLRHCFTGPIQYRIP